MSSVLANPVELGEGRSIRPPLDWSVAMYQVDDPMHVEPPPRCVMTPPGKHFASLSWFTSAALVGKASADYFAYLLNKARILTVKELEPLYPILIRIPIANIVDMRINDHEGLGLVLAISYIDSETGSAGHAIYAPTSELPGEIQILTYEGLEHDYNSFWDQAKASINSFIDTYLLGR